jgi:two-component system phosphate regulon sensor histidine kinase PhoR
VLEIKDNGIGMKPETLKHCFDRFYRESTGNIHDVKGFGLGLSYVKEIIDLHHGNVSVKSETGKGTTFELIFPLCKTLNS